MPRGSRWRMAKPCADCPFNKKGPGLRLRRTLARGRWKEITDGLKAGAYFMCHKTTAETGNGTNLLCAGSIAYQEERGTSSNYQRVCESLEYFRKKRKSPATTR